MATGTTSLTIHAPTPRPASSIMLNVLSTPSNTSVQASQPPKPSIAPGPSPATRTVRLTRPENRQLLGQKVVTAAIHRRIDGPQNTITFLLNPSPPRALRSNQTTAPHHTPLSTTVALHNAERRISLIPTREKYFRTRPRPAARGKRILSSVLAVLPENEVYPPPPAPPVLGHPMVRTMASRPRARPQPRPPVADENTVPFPTKTPALPSSLPKARRTVRAASYSLPRPPFGQLSV